MENKLHQLNINYDSHQDRLILKITTTNSDEYRIWLTRRFSQLLNQILETEISKRGGSTEIVQKKQTTSMLKAGALEQPFQGEKSENFPLGEEGILAYGIKTGKNEAGSLVLEIQNAEKKGMSLNLNDSLLYMFHSLLSQGIQRADWSLQSQVESGTVSNKIH